MELSVPEMINRQVVLRSAGREQLSYTQGPISQRRWRDRSSRSRLRRDVWHRAAVCGLGGSRSMAAPATFSIVTFQRKPGHWRAAITSNDRSGIFILGITVASFVTQDSFPSEADANRAAEQLIKTL